MRFPLERWLPVVALILAWQVFAWQLPQVPEGGPSALKNAKETVVALAGNTAFTLVEVKPGDIKKDSPGKWLVVGTIMFARCFEVASIKASESLVFGTTRIWLLHRALLL